jgi:hypothetical protein
LPQTHLSSWDHAEGVSVLSINQRSQGKAWQYLGLYTLDEESFIDVQTFGTDGLVIADAFKLVKASWYSTALPTETREGDQLVPVQPPVEALPPEPEPEPIPDNTAPQLAKQLPDLVVQQHIPVMIELTEVFTDPDNDTLNFTFLTDAAIDYLLEDGVLEMAGKQPGEAIITIRAADAWNETNTSFRLNVLPGKAAGLINETNLSSLAQKIAAKQFSKGIELKTL